MQTTCTTTAVSDHTDTCVHRPRDSRADTVEGQEAATSEPRRGGRRWQDGGAALRVATWNLWPCSADDLTVHRHVVAALLDNW